MASVTVKGRTVEISDEAAEAAVKPYNKGWATINIQGRIVEIPEQDAENAVRPFEEARKSGLVNGQAVVTRLKYHRTGMMDPSFEPTYGPVFILGRVEMNPAEKRSPLFIPTCYPELAEIKGCGEFDHVAAAYQELCVKQQVFRHPLWDPK